MAVDLKTYFPMIRTREEILSEISENQALQAMYRQWNAEQRNAFLDYCTGQRGVKILYDPFFKEILNPETDSARVEELLTLLLDRKVRILHVLPLESPRMGDENSLVVMDLVVELEDKSLVNVEVQRLGYRFPGQRAACYSADLLLRQYRRVRDAKKKKFSYRDMQRVCTVVLYEKSTREFHQYPEHYRHRFLMQSNTGLQLELLQEYLFIPLDIFSRILHNRDIQSPLEAWLTFLSTDDPERIEKLILYDEKFQAYYEELYELCRNTEEVMRMFSKELQEMDRNTVQYMIDELQEEVDQQRGMINQQERLLKEKEEALSASQAENRRLRELLEKMQSQ